MLAGVNSADLPTVVSAWTGNAFDAFGTAPIILYTGVVGGVSVYIGMDRLDSVPTSNPGSSYWYNKVVLGAPDFTDYNPSLESLGCPGTTFEWQGGGSNQPPVDKYDFVMIGVVVFWTTIVFIALGAMLYYHRGQHQLTAQPMAATDPSPCFARGPLSGPDLVPRREATESDPLIYV